MSLRTRLILTHVFVIFLTLGIVAISLIVIFQNYQRQIQLARLGNMLCVGGHARKKSKEFS